MEIFKASFVDTHTHKQNLLRLGQQSLLETSDGNIRPSQEILQNPLVLMAGSVALLFPWTRKIILRATPFLISRLFR